MTAKVDRGHRVLVGVLCSFLCALGCVGAAQDRAAALDAVVLPYVEKHAFMGSVLVARGDDILLDKGYGSANLEWDVPNTPATKFRLGSLTKQFTAASILLLEERGRLKIEDPINKYLPDAPPAWNGITIFHLLTHSSGVPNFTSFPEYKSIEPFPTTADKLVTSFRDKPLDFAPGEKMSYSNSGYLVLGLLIEKLTGQSYSMFVKENIFTPLGMNDSGYDSNSVIIPHRASGYSPLGTTLTNAGFIHMTVPHAAGALYSTTGDLLKWTRGLFGGKVITAASLQKMTTPYKNSYAFGLVVRDDNGRRTISHNGGIEGFNTTLLYHPDQKVTVAVLANVNGAAPQDIAVKLAALAVK